MNTNLQSKTTPQNNQTDARDDLVGREIDSPGREKILAFNVQTGLQAGVQDSDLYNDRARARKFAQASANFLADFFS